MIFSLSISYVRTQEDMYFGYCHQHNITAQGDTLFECMNRMSKLLEIYSKEPGGIEAVAPLPATLLAEFASPSTPAVMG